MLTQNYTTKQQLRPYIEQLASPINVQDYLKSISDTQIITIESLVKEMISNNKKATTLTELQFLHDWNDPNGIVPSRAHEWEDILAMIGCQPIHDVRLGVEFAVDGINARNNALR